MKNNKEQLDVDFIGNQVQPITALELKIISEYFQKKKAKKQHESKKRSQFSFKNNTTPYTAL